MKTRQRIALGILPAFLGMGLLASAPAMADLVIDLSYSNLDGDWNGVDTFTAVASDLIGIGTWGMVERHYAPTGFAWFAPGFFGGSSADFQMSMHLINIGATTADVDYGTLTITDADGDTMTGDVSGQWSLLGSSVNFDGLLGNILFTDWETQDGTFNGAGTGGDNGTSFSMDFGSLVLPFSGAIDTLSFPDGVEFFDDGNFQDAVTQGGAQVIPAPSAVLLGAIGLGLIGRIRRWI